ncbi:ATP synthase F1 subunit epsilon [Patulibacter sp. S7RM1-6]
MAHTPFRADVLTPTGELFSGEVQQVSTRTVAGEIGILAKHVPLLGRLEPAELRLTLPDDGAVKRWVQTGGYLQVAQDGNVLLLVDHAFPIEEYDQGKAEEEQRQAEERLAATEKGTEAHRLALAGKRRADALVRVGTSLGRR